MEKMRGKKTVDAAWKLGSVRVWRRDGVGVSSLPSEAQCRGLGSWRSASSQMASFVVNPSHLECHECEAHYSGHRTTTSHDLTNLNFYFPAFTHHAHPRQCASSYDQILIKLTNFVSILDFKKTIKNKLTRPTRRKFTYRPKFNFKSWFIYFNYRSAAWRLGDPAVQP